MNMVNRFHGVPNIIVFLTVLNLKVPFVSEESRITVQTYGDNIFGIVARCGYSENRIRVDKMLEEAEEIGLPKEIHGQTVTYFVNRDRVQVLAGLYWRRIPLTLYSYMKKIFGGIPNNIYVPFTEVVEIATRTPIGYGLYTMRQ